MQNVVIIYGGKSCESEISVLTALSVFSSVKNQYAVELVYLKNGRFFIGKKLQKIGSYGNFSIRGLKTVTFMNGKMYRAGLPCPGKKIDCAVICCHGGEGENGSLAGLMEIADIAYTSCGPLQSAVCMDKVFTKYLLRYFHLPTLPFRVYQKGEESVFSEIEYPVILKPSSLGSSIGISFAQNKEEGEKRGIEALAFDKKVLIEPALTGFREYTCAVFREKGDIVVGQIEEVISGGAFYDFDEKYRGGEVKRVYPAQIPIALENKIYRICKKIYECFEMKGAVRIDFLDDGKLYVNEINAVPGSLSWYLFKGKGYDLASLCRILIEEGIKEKESKDALFTDFSGSVLRDFTFGGKGKGIGKTDA